VAFLSGVVMVLLFILDTVTFVVHIAILSLLDLDPLGYIRDIGWLASGPFLQQFTTIRNLKLPNKIFIGQRASHVVRWADRKASFRRTVMGVKRASCALLEEDDVERGHAQVQTRPMSQTSRLAISSTRHVTCLPHPMYSRSAVENVPYLFCTSSLRNRP
jgi:hypothetical protein